MYHHHSFSSQGVLSLAAKRGCYRLLLIPVLEILSGGTEHPLDPVWRRPCQRISLARASNEGGVGKSGKTVDFRPINCLSRKRQSDRM